MYLEKLDRCGYGCCDACLGERPLVQNSLNASDIGTSDSEDRDVEKRIFNHMLARIILQWGHTQTESQNAEEGNRSIPLAALRWSWFAGQFDGFEFSVPRPNI